MYLRTCPAPTTAGLPEILAALNTHATASGLKRFDQTPELIEASFQVQFDTVARLDECSQELRKLGDGVRISYLEQNDLSGAIILVLVAAAIYSVIQKRRG